MDRDTYRGLLPRPVSQGLVVLMSTTLILAAVAGALWVFAQGTWTYSRYPVDASTTDRLARLHASLIAADAPEAAVRLVARAARPGTYQGDAIEALADAGRILAATRSDNESLAAVRQELRAVYNDLYAEEHGYQMHRVSGSSTPMILPLPTQ